MKINKSVDRSIKILEVISESRSGLTLAEIQKILEIPKSSAFDIIQTLLVTEMITTHHYDSKRYITGLKSFLIGSAYQSDLLKIAGKHLKVLSDSLGKTAFIGVEREGEVVYMDKYEPKIPFITTATLGSRNPIHCTALGKAILSKYPEELVRSILESKGMLSMTENTIITQEKFKVELEEVREKGYSVDDRELEENVLCIGAPVFDFSGRVIAAISISGMYRGERDIPFLGNKVKETAGIISKELGYRK